MKTCIFLHQVFVHLPKFSLKCDEIYSMQSKSDCQISSATDQLRYIKIQPETIGIDARLWRINPINSIFYFPEPHICAYCLMLNFNILQSVYS